MSDQIIEANKTIVIPAPDEPFDTTEPSVDDAFSGLEEAIRKDREVESSKAKEDKTVEKEAVSDEKPTDSKPKLELKPKETTEPVVEEIPDDAAVPRKSEDWKKFRKSYNETRALLKDRESKLAELQAKTENLKQLESLQKERDELAAKYKELSVVGDPELTKDLDSKIEVSLNGAKRGLDPKKAALVETIARMPDSDAKTNLMNELFEDMPAAKQVLIGAHLANLEQLAADRDSRLADARKNADAIIARRQQEQEANQRAVREQFDRAFTDATNELKSKDGWKDIFENKELAAAVESQAKQIYSGNLTNPKALAEKAIHAAVTPMLMEYAIQQATQLAEAQKTIAELKAAGPKIGAAIPPGGKIDSGVDGFSTEAIAAALNA